MTYAIERTEGGKRFRLSPDLHLGLPNWYEFNTFGWNRAYEFASIPNALAFMDHEPFTDFVNAEVVIA